MRAPDSSLEPSFRRTAFAEDENEIYKAEIRMLGTRPSDANALPLTQIPTHIYCGADLAFRPIIAVRYPESTSETGRRASLNEPGLLHLWDSRSSSALVPVLFESVTGRRPLSHAASHATLHARRGQAGRQHPRRVGDGPIARERLRGEAARLGRNRPSQHPRQVDIAKQSSRAG